MKETGEVGKLSFSYESKRLRGRSHRERGDKLEIGVNAGDK